MRGIKMRTTKEGKQMNKMLKIAELFNAVLEREMNQPEKDGLVGIHVSFKGEISIHVTDEYFDEHFDHYHCKSVDQPRHGNERVSFETESGNEIFCLRAVEYTRARLLKNLSERVKK